MEEKQVTIESLQASLDAARFKHSSSGVEYWRARDLMCVLGYETWENFEKAVLRAMESCGTAGVAVENQFRETTKKVPIGSGSNRELRDYFLTKYACYLVAMNGDPSKPEISFAQMYFAVQTHRQEVQDRLAEDEKRIDLRERVMNANRTLSGVAKDIGVQNFGLFNDAGYRGLYGEMGLADIKLHKGIPESDKLLDRCGRAELAMNEFRITQTEQKLVRERISGERRATETHRSVGAEIRRTVEKIGGTMPENLPPEPSIKKLLAKRKANAKKQLAKPSSTLLPPPS